MRRFGLIWLLLAATWVVPADAQLRHADGLAAYDAGDVARARAIWQPLAERGDALAQYNLGVLALREGGDARSWFEAAAAQGNQAAQRALADFLADEADWGDAARWYRAAASQGDADAAHRLALLHDHDKLDDAASGNAMRWYRRAAELGSVDAQYMLGDRLANQGEPEAEDWLARAAAKGHVAATFKLARITEASDQAKARALYRKAAIAGSGAASYNLGLMHARGKGGTRSFRIALTWALIAKGQGFEKAAALEAAALDVLPPDIQAAARAAANACLARPAACP